MINKAKVVSDLQAMRFAGEYGWSESLSDDYVEQLATYILQGGTGETQQTVAKWADETFGPARNNIGGVTRANKEMAELLHNLAVDDKHPKAKDEIADIGIVLYRVCQNLGFDFHEAIDEKMAVNRKRKWVLDGSGHGQHVPDSVVVQVKHNAI